MTCSPFQAAYDSAITMMATALLLQPAVNLDDHGACADCWREQRVAEICITEFGDEARAQARARLRRAAGEAERVAIPPAPPVSMVDHRDGGRLSSSPSEEAAVTNEPSPAGGPGWVGLLGPDQAKDGGNTAADCRFADCGDLRLASREVCDAA